MEILSQANPASVVIGPMPGVGQRRREKRARFEPDARRIRIERQVSPEPLRSNEKTRRPLDLFQVIG
jgi:hypothetical protein